MREHRVSAVIFDMDGVITNTMPDHFQAWKRALASAGVSVTHEDIYSREGQPGKISIEELSRKYGKTFSNKEKERILEEKEACFRDIRHVRFIPNSRSFINKLHKGRFRLALVTGTSRTEVERILPESLLKKFETVVTGDDVHHGKPHPEPYLLALRALNLSADQAIVLENAPFGIASAKAAGLRCLALQTSLPAEYLKEADAVFASIQELTGKISFERPYENSHSQ